MADFKLNEVAKKVNLTAEQAVEKLKAAGVEVSGVEASITVEQMRILGVTPQQMIDRRKERLQQALERRNRGTLGKEVMVRNRSKEEPVQNMQTTKKISKEDLQKRKSELNKGLQKIDEERKQYQIQKENGQLPEKDKADDKSVGLTAGESNTVPPVSESVVNKPVLDDTPAGNIADIASVATPVENENTSATHEIKPTVQENAIKTVQDAQQTASPEPSKNAVSEPTAQKSSVAARDKSTHRPQGAKQDSATASTPKTTPDGKVKVPAGPAGYKPVTRPTGPAADQNKSYNNRPRTDSRDSRDTRDSRGPRDASRTGTYRDRDQSRDSKDSSQSRDPRNNPRNQRQSFARPESATLTEEEKRRREKKPVKEVEPAKDEPKKAKVKATDPAKAKDWSKAIIEGINELDIEKEVNEGKAPEAEPAPAKPAYSGKTDRKQRKKFERTKKSDLVITPKPTHITIGEAVTVSELAGMIGIKAAELVKKLFNAGIIASVNQSIDAETATLLCIDYGVEVSTKIITEEDLLPKYEENPEDMKRRPPVVTVMGHVDHGKTSLLDAIRSAAVAEREAGGITQHIGAYEVELGGRKITFLDTPGHEAFTMLRARGAQVTDIVILVVAANDGVMPQTKEAIDHAKAAGVRIVVAVNKIDRPDANPDKVRQQLAEYGIISDEWGGEYQFQEISAKQRTGIEDLLERVLLEADILELQGNPNVPAEGIVIESKLDKQKGPIATVLVKKGTLKRGDTFVVGSETGKVRSMYNYRGTVVKEAGISMPVEVMGFSEVPESGDTFMVLQDEKLAKEIAELRSRNEKDVRSSSSALSLSDFFSKVKQGEVKELNIIIKADVQGSLEALKSSLLKLSNVEVKVNVVHDATGGINESDVVLAIASKAIIIGFNVRPDANAKSLADKEGISIELYSIIYKAIEDVKLALEGMLTPDSKEHILGKVEVRQVFSVPKLGKIAGAYVLEGKITRNSLVRVIRDNVVIYDGKIGSLKRFTDDVKEVAHGYECGLSVDRYQDIKEGDILEAYEIVEEKRTLDDVMPN